MVSNNYSDKENYNLRDFLIFLRKYFSHHQLYQYGHASWGFEGGYISLHTSIMHPGPQAMMTIHYLSV